MPFIQIKSLPFEKPFDIDIVLEELTKDFVKETGISLEHVTATWEFLPSGHYAVGGKVAQHQPVNSHSVLVDLLAPDFNSGETIEKMLRVVASSVAKYTNLPIENVFINYRQAHTGQVFDAGNVVHW